MSLKTWKKEFYPLPASKVKGKRAAIKHSLKKWMGLTEENLAKHSVEIGHQYDYNITVVTDDRKSKLKINSSSCALCKLFYDNHTDEDKACRRCPLYKSLGHPCDGMYGRPFIKWTNELNPEPMIKALQKL